ncbi:hypothetical protein BH10PLA2_BH10PLA2_32230 [soil metagenome]
MLANATTLAGQTIGARYRVAELLGQGGMGQVYRAHDQNLEVDIVIKVPLAEYLQDEEFQKRFQREARALVKFNHPHVCRIQDVGDHQGVPFLVLQYLSGGTLEDRLLIDRDGRRLPGDPAELGGWLPDIAKALDFIHGKGYVHRDVKPANIIFDEHRQAYLSDFGIVKSLGEEAKRTIALTRAGTGIGTPEYMAPELVMGQPFDGRVDQYALAATVYEVLSGRPVFEGATPSAIYVMQTRDLPTPLKNLVPGLAPSLYESVERALAKKAENRYATCSSFAEAVIEHLRRYSSVVAATDHHESPGQNRGKGRSPKEKTANCPSCKTSVRLEEDSTEKRVRCRNCGHVFERVRLFKSSTNPRGPATNRTPSTRSDKETEGALSSRQTRRQVKKMIPLEPEREPGNLFTRRPLLLICIASVTGVMFLVASGVIILSQKDRERQSAASDHTMARGAEVATIGNTTPKASLGKDKRERQVGTAPVVPSYKQGTDDTGQKAGIQPRSLQENIDSFYSCAGLKCGDTLDHLIRVYGQPLQIQTYPSVAQYLYFNGHFSVNVDYSRRKITEIIIDAQAAPFIRQKGIQDLGLRSIGKTLEQISRAFGPLKSSENAYVYYLTSSKGRTGSVYFSAGDDSVCSGIEVRWRDN